MHAAWPAQVQHAPPRPKSVFSGVLLALIVFFVVLPIGGVITCAFCAGVMRESAKDRAKGTPSAAPTLVEWQDWPSPTPVDDPPSAMASIAGFINDTVLDECADSSYTLTAGADAGAGAVEKLRDYSVKRWTDPKGNKPKGLTLIYKPCAEQFRTNAVLATCKKHSTEHVTHADSGVPIGTMYEVQMVSRYYNLDTLTSSDEYMKDCLDIKGDWQGIDKDSAAYREATRARARREMEKGLKALGR
jgi:hypothetical protein